MTASLSRTATKALATFTGNADFASMIDSTALLDEVCFQPNDKRSLSWAGVIGTAQFWVNILAEVNDTSKKIKMVAIVASGAGNMDIVHVQKSGNTGVVVKTDTVTCVTGLNFFLIDSIGVTFNTTTWIGIKAVADKLQYANRANTTFYFATSGATFSGYSVYDISYWCCYEPRAYVQHVAQRLPLASFDLAYALTQFDDVLLPSGDITLTSTVVVPANKTIRGVRGKTRLLLASGIVGLEINAAASVTLRDFDIIGNNAAVDITSTALLNSDANIESLNGMGTEKGIYIHGPAANDCLISGVVCKNINGVGINIFDTTSASAANAAGVAISDVTLRDCYLGMRFQSTGEYNTIQNLRASKNQIGLAIYGGNNTFTGGQLIYNRVNLLLGPSTNNGHGTITGVPLNHSGLYGLYCYDLTYGFILVGCHAWYGGWRVKNTAGLQWTSGMLSNSSIALVDCGNVSIADTQEFQGVPVTPSGTTVFEQKGRRDLTTGRIKEPFVRIN